MSRRRLAIAVLLVLGAAVGSAAGPPEETQVSAEVSELLQTSAQPLVLNITVDQGGSSSPQALGLDVLSNLPAGYAVTVRRTALLRGDLPVRLAGVPPADPMLVLDFPTASTTLPAGPERAFGHRSSTISAPAGDRWQARLVVGRLACPETGLHTGVLAFTTRAGERTDIAPIALVVNVRRNRRACG